MARDDPSGEWRPEGEASAASGGHMSPDPSAAGPLFEPFGSPYPQENLEGRTSQSPSSSASSSRSDTTSSPSYSGEADFGPVTGARLNRRPRTGARRVTRTLRHLDPLSVLKLSLIFYTVFLLVWLVLVALLFNLLESVGVFDVVNQVLDGFAEDEVDVNLFVVERWALLLGLTGVVLGSIVNVLLTLLYNLVARWAGGAEMTFTERDV